MKLLSAEFRDCNGKHGRKWSPWQMTWAAHGFAPRPQKTHLLLVSLIPQVSRPWDRAIPMGDEDSQTFGGWRASKENQAKSKPWLIPFAVVPLWRLIVPGTFTQGQQHSPAGWEALSSRDSDCSRAAVFNPWAMEPQGLQTS